MFLLLGTPRPQDHDAALSHQPNFYRHHKSGKGRAVVMEVVVQDNLTKWPLTVCVMQLLWMHFKPVNNVFPVQHWYYFSSVSSIISQSPTLTHSGTTSWIFHTATFIFQTKAWVSAERRIMCAEQLQISLQALNMLQKKKNLQGLWLHDCSNAKYIRECNVT